MKAYPALLGAEPRSILVRGVNWLGDAVMTTPALQRLRERFPEARIAILTHEKLAQLWQGHPSLNEVLTFGSRDSVWAIGRRLRAESFELALVLPNSPRSALEVWLGRIPQRAGVQRPWRNWLLTLAIPPRAGRLEMRKRTPAEVKRLTAVSNGMASRLREGGSQHEPGPSASSPMPPMEGRAGERRLAPYRDSGTTGPDGNVHQLNDYLHLVGALGAETAPVAPLLSVEPKELIGAGQKFGLVEPAFRNRPLFGLNPGAEYGPAKRWPAERFVAAAREIQKRTNCVWLLFGGKGDVTTVGTIEAQLQAGHSSNPGVVNLAGKTSLRELLALLKSCAVVLTNDTGPMHLAAALGVPVVVPFGSTSPELTGPGLPGDARNILVRNPAPCAPCFLRSCPIDFRCMMGIEPGQVVEAVLRAAV
jgi:heptosyltransferase-2